MDQKRVGILIFKDVEVLDFCGPFEVFSVTRLAPQDEQSPFEVLVISETADVVHARGGLKIVPDVTTADCPPLDILVVPGGRGTRTEINNQPLIDWIATRNQEVETMTSVCTGSLLLAQANLLNNLPATTHWGALDMMRQKFPQVSVIDDQHVVEHGRILTSAGISAGIDMALQVVARYHGEATARHTARQMEYPYPESNHRRVKI